MKIIPLDNEKSIKWEFWPCPGNSDQDYVAWAYQMFKKYVFPGSFVVDIGAFTGDYAIPMALLAGNNGKVLAFEPNPNSFAPLLVNVALNELTNIECHNVAIMPEDKSYIFHYAQNGYLNGGYVDGLATPMAQCKIPHVMPLEIVGKRLEPYLPKDRKVDFLKIDTEGYDYHILQSIADFIRRDRPVIMAEVFTDLTEQERIEFRDTVESLGYTVEHETPELKHFTKDIAFDVILYPK